MATIDKLLEKIARQNAECAVLRNDQPICLWVSGREASGPVLPVAQLQRIIEEVTPAHLLPQLAIDGQFSFPYQSPHGLFNIGVERGNGKLQVSITPSSSAGKASVARPQAVTPPGVATPAPRPPSMPPVLPSAPPQPAPSSVVNKQTGFAQQRLLWIALCGVFVIALVGVLWSANEQQRKKAERTAAVAVDLKGYLSQLSKAPPERDKACVMMYDDSTLKSEGVLSGSITTQNTQWSTLRGQVKVALDTQAAYHDNFLSKISPQTTEIKQLHQKLLSIEYDKGEALLRYNYVLFGKDGTCGFGRFAYGCSVPDPEGQMQALGQFRKTDADYRDWLKKRDSLAAKYGVSMTIS